MSGSLPRKMTPTAALVEHVTHFHRRVLQDALADATATYWNRRADAFLAARPRLGDYTGRASREDLRNQWHRLTETANACRARARVSVVDDLAPEAARALREVA